MSAHVHREVTPGCYRCELNQDEVASALQDIEADAQAAWLRYRDHRDQRWMKRTQMRRREFIAGFIACELGR